MRSLLVLFVFTAAILAYGYWHASTHASFFVSLHDAGETDLEPDSIPRVEFLDSNGKVLASGVRDEQHDFVRLIHPAYGDCREAEKRAAFSVEARTAWHECFERQSVWIASWIKKVDRVNIYHRNCVIRRRPIQVSGPNSSWYLWWVPHPHIGGNPYSDYSARITLELEACNELLPDQP